MHFLTASRLILQEAGGSVHSLFVDRTVRPTCLGLLGGPQVLLIGTESGSVQALGLESGTAGTLKISDFKISKLLVTESDPDCQIVGAVSAQHDLIWVQVFPQPGKIELIIRSILSLQDEKVAPTIQLVAIPSQKKGLALVHLCRGLRLLKIGKSVKHLHALDWTEPDDCSQNAAAISLKETDDTIFELNIVSQVGQTLRLFYCRFEKGLGMTNFRLLKSIDAGQAFASLTFLNPQVVMAVDLTGSISEVSLPELATVPNSSSDFLVTDVKSTSAALVVTGSCRRNNRIGFFRATLRTAKEIAKTGLAAGLFLQAMCVLVAEKETPGSTVLAEDLANLAKTASRSFFKQLLKSHSASDQDFQQNSELIIEFLLRMNIKIFINELISEAKASSQGSLALAALGNRYIEVSFGRGDLDLQGLNPEFVILIFETLYDRGLRGAAAELVLKNSFVGFPLIGELSSILKSFQLPFPILKLIIDDSLAESELLLALFSIFIQSGTLRRFSCFLINALRDQAAIHPSLKKLDMGHLTLFRQFFWREECISSYLYEPTAFLEVYSDPFLASIGAPAASIREQGDSRLINSVLFAIVSSQTSHGFPYDFLSLLIQACPQKETSRVDFCCSLLAMRLITDRVETFDDFTVSFGTKLVDLVLKNMSLLDSKELQEVLVSFLERLVPTCEALNISCGPLLHRLQESSEAFGFSYLHFSALRIAGQDPEALRVFLSSPPIHFQVKIHDWLVQLLTSSVPQSKKAEVADLFAANLALFSSISPTGTKKVIDSYGEFSHKSLEALLEHPEFVLRKLFNDLSGNRRLTLPLQETFVRCALTLNSPCLIGALRRFPLDLNHLASTFQLPIRAQGVICSRQGNQEGLKELIKQQAGAIAQAASVPALSDQQTQVGDFIFLLLEHSAATVPDGNKSISFYQEIFDLLGDHSLAKAKNKGLVTKILTKGLKRELNLCTFASSTLGSAAELPIETVTAVLNLTKVQAQLEKIKAGITLVDSIEKRKGLTAASKRGIKSLDLMATDRISITPNPDQNYLKFFIMLEKTSADRPQRII